MTTTPNQPDREREAAFRAGFMEATQYDWDYAADGHEQRLCDEAWAKYSHATPLLDDETVERCAVLSEAIGKEWQVKAEGYRRAGNNGPLFGEPTGFGIATAIRALKRNA